MEAPPVQYVTTHDGYSIAYSMTGAGQPLVFLPLGLNHIQLAWKQDGRISGWLAELASRFRLVQYDTRGEGMSQRGLTAKHRMADYETDLEAVMGRLGPEPAVLLGYFYSAHVALRYAIRHPERVRALILVSSSLLISAWPLDSLLRLAEQNWDAMLHNWVPPTATPEERAGYLAFFKETRTQADWLISAAAFSVSRIDDVVTQVRTPTLVMHPRDFLWLAPQESAKLAAAIPEARFSLIDGVLPLGEAAQGVAAIEAFLADLTPLDAPSAGDRGTLRDSLSAREVEVLRLVASGRSNQQIADELVISLNTVARHVSNIFVKTGAANRAEAAAFAARRGLL
jgi:pimeloyl-ACP methyl ester carboxylesterase/DNA-binding CsgD family transcriptional regulator